MSEKRSVEEIALELARSGELSAALYTPRIVDVLAAALRAYGSARDAEWRAAAARAGSCWGSICSQRENPACRFCAPLRALKGEPSGSAAPAATTEERAKAGPSAPSPIEHPPSDDHPGGPLSRAERVVLSNLKGGAMRARALVGGMSHILGAVPGAQKIEIAHAQAVDAIDRLLAAMKLRKEGAPFPDGSPTSSRAEGAEKP